MCHFPDKMQHPHNKNDLHFFKIRSILWLEQEPLPKKTEYQNGKPHPPVADQPATR